MKEFYKYRPHPWHGLTTGDRVPDVVNAFIEITPFDLVKYETDKKSGYLRVDRPHRTSSLPPTLYGFVPRTYAGDKVAALMKGAQSGDHDPLDICVMSERPIARAEVVLHARIVGGIPMLDHGEADDKLIAVLVNDNVWDDVRDVAELPQQLVDRLRHYFSTYKLLPGEPAQRVKVGAPYGVEHARKVLAAAIADYQAEFVD
ncbi:MAG: inorganic pyrophosphatase [Gammaproteobacteria bacterium]|nr:inorganic pyrophosphatase [Gammaproteobacteria bacterium]NND60372.1 inorganic pyrophosphatase [Gammaproteobacteria bacterium]